MRKFVCLLLSVLLIIGFSGCKPSSVLIQSQITVITEEYSSDDSSTTTSPKVPEKSSSKTPTSSKASSSPSSIPSKPEDIVLNEITTPDGEKAVEITTKKNDPAPNDNSSSGGESSSDTQSTGPALPPSIEDLDDLHGDDNTSEPDNSSSNNDTADSSDTAEQSSSEENEPSTSSAVSDLTTTTSLNSEIESNETSDNTAPTTPTEHIPVSYEQRYRYNLLSLTQKVLYRQILNATEKLEYQVRFMQPHTISEVVTVLDAVITDNPEYFYLCMSGIILHDGNGNAGQLNLMFSDSVNTNTDADGYCIEVSSTLKASILRKKTFFNIKTKSILDKIDPALPDVEKEKLIYDTLLKQARYNLDYAWTDAVPDDWTAYGVLASGLGVCESYSEAFQHLCLSVGINCTLVRGDAGGAHQWNAVQLDGEWYECDVTFDDPIGVPSGMVYSHNYFNLTTQKMNQLNHFAYSSEPSPIATGTKYSYKNYFNN